MADINYVMYSLDFCANKGDCKDCLYEQNDNEDSTGCLNKLMVDALELLKEFKEHEELLIKLGYHWTGSGETLALCKKSKVGEQE